MSIIPFNLAMFPYLQDLLDNSVAVGSGKLFQLGESASTAEHLLCRDDLCAKWESASIAEHHLCRDEFGAKWSKTYHQVYAQ